MAKVKVLKEFRDKFNFSKIYKAGDEVDGFDKGRIADLVNRGLAEEIKEVAPKGRPAAKKDKETKEKE